MFVAAGLALAVAGIAPQAGIATGLGATRSHTVIVDTQLSDIGTIGIIYTLGPARTVDTDWLERISTLAVVAALDASAMLGLIGQTVPLVRTIAV